MKNIQLAMLAGLRFFPGMDWYYEKDGQQNGPVSETELLRLHNNGVISGDNLLWCEGMTGWERLAVVFAKKPDGVGESVALPEKVREDMAAKARRAGFGGDRSSAELRAAARQSLAGSWLMAGLVVFLYHLISQLASLLPVIGLIAPLLLGGPLFVGLYAYFLGRIRGEPVELGILFSGFTLFWRHVGVFLLTSLIIGGSALVVALPGIFLFGPIIVGTFENSANSGLVFLGVMVTFLPAVLVGLYFWLRYSLVYLIAVDEPELGVMEILQMSSHHMQARKARLGWLLASFLGWHLLGLLAFFVGLLWSTAYMLAGIAAFYEDCLADKDATG